MSKRINMNSGAAAQGGVGVGQMTSAGNPWTVPDELANELVNRQVATYVDTQSRGLLPVQLDPLTGQQYAGGILVSGHGKWILTGSTAGQSSDWRLFRPGMQLALGLDSGSIATQWSIDIGGDGSTPLGQAWTDSWDKSTAFLLSPPMYLSTYMIGLYLQALNAGTASRLYYRFNNLGAVGGGAGGPLSVAEL